MRYNRLLVFGIVAVSLHAYANTRVFAEGAFAFGQTNNGGWGAGAAYNARTKQDADFQAVNNCATRAPGCVIKYRFTNTCFAYAVQKPPYNGYGYATNPDPGAAQRQALETCNQHGVSCDLKGVYCDTISEEVEKERFATFTANLKKCFSGASLDSDIRNAQSACDEALSYDRITPVTRSNVTARQASIAALLDQRQTAREAQQRNYENNRSQCEKYIPLACLRAMNSPLADKDAKTQLAQYNSEGVIFAIHATFCSSGSAVACDKALASPAAHARDDEARLRNIKSGLPVYQRLWAAIFPQLPLSIQDWAYNSRNRSQSSSLSSLGDYFKDLPRSTLVAGFIALALAISLAGILWKNHLPAIASTTSIPSPIRKAAKPKTSKGPAKMENSNPTTSTAYILNLLLPGAGNIYFGQPIIGCIFILSILFGIFIFMAGASAAAFGIIIIIVSLVAAIFTLGLSLIALPIGLLFLMMGAGPVLAFVIWFFSLIASELLVRSKAKKMEIIVQPSA